MVDNEAGQPDTQETGQPVDQAVTEASQATAPTPSEADTLKTQLSELQSERDRLSGDLKSIRGLLRKGLNDQARIDKLEQGIDAMNEAIVQLASDLSGDATVPAKFAQLRQQQEQRRQQVSQSVQGQMQTKWNEIGQQVAIAHKLNLRTKAADVQHAMQTKKEWADVLSLAQDAFQQGDMSLLDEALDKAQEVRASIQEATLRDAIAEAVAKARKEVETQAQEKLTRAGVFSTAAASTAAAGNGKRTEFTQEEIEAGGPEFVKQHFDEIKAAQRAGRIK